LRTYELVLVVRPEVDEDGYNALIATLSGLVTENGGQVVDVEYMGRRRLAYPINKVTEAHYVLLHLNLETPGLNELERRLKLTEDVVRHLVVRLDELMEPAPPAEEQPEGAEEEAEGEQAAAQELDADDLAAELADELAEGPTA
jgi:small subunit ribosomal protein S6